MDFVLLIARLLLAATFAVAGVAKLFDLAGSRRVMRDFGLPAALAAPFGLLLPLAEIAVAVALLPRASAWWGGLGALALLLAFVAAIGIGIARGRQPACHCFGQLHSAPAGWPTLARNGGLAVVATIFIWQGRDGAGAAALAWTGNLTTLEAVTFVLVALAVAVAAVEGWFVVHLLGQQGRLLIRLDELESRPAGSSGEPQRGLPAGATAPAFALPGLDGERVSLDSLLAGGKDLLLVFMHPSCGPCNALLPDLTRWQRDLADRLEVVVIGRHDPDANRAKAEMHGLHRVLMDANLDVARAYDALATPSAVLVRADGTIAAPLAGGFVKIRELVSRKAGQVGTQSARANGANGSRRALTELAGAPPAEVTMRVS